MNIRPLLPLLLCALSACASFPSDQEMQDRRQIADQARRFTQPPLPATPIREPINRLKTDPFPALIAVLDDPSHALTDQERSYLGQLKENLKLVHLGETWPKPGRFDIPKCKSPVTLTGTLSDPAWQHAMTWSDSYPFNKTAPSPDTQTLWKVMWDDKYLYFGYACADDTPVTLPRKRDDSIYSDDCVEFYISPDIRYRTYWEVDVGRDGQVYDAIQCKHENLWACDSNTAANVPGMLIKTSLTGPSGKPGYTVEIAFPWSAILPQPGQKPAPGSTYAFMLTRMDSANGRTYPYSPIPVLAWAHNIWNMATLRLVE